MFCRRKSSFSQGLWFAVLMLFVFLCGGCSHPGPEPDNYPYEPDTPTPAAHDGTFVSDHGSMVFNGDGESIVIDFDKELSELTGLPEGSQKGKYAFLSGNLPPHGSMPVRYDIAHELEITVAGQSAVVDMGIAAEDGKSGQVGARCCFPEAAFVPWSFRRRTIGLSWSSFSRNRTEVIMTCGRSTGWTIRTERTPQSSNRGV